MEYDRLGNRVHAPLSIVQLCAPAAVGGLESVVMAISRGLSERGHDLTVVAAVAPEHDPSQMLDPLARAGIRTLALQFPSRAYLREWKAVGRFLDQARPDLLHTHGYRSDVLHGSSARRRGIATVTTLHGFNLPGEKRGIGQWLQERALRRFDGVVAVSRMIEKTVQDMGTPADRIHLIPNAWSPTGALLDRTEARIRLGLPPGGTSIAWIGRLVPIKGPDIFLQSLAKIRNTDWTACIIGDGPDRPALEQMAHTMGLSERVHFAGLVHEAARHLSAFDLLVLSSRSEGTPIVALEAMGAGIPVVATSVGGVPDLLGNGSSGWLVPTEDPVALGETIDLILSDREGAEAKIRMGRSRIESDLSSETWMHRHEEVYRSAIERRRTAGPRH